MPATDDGSGDRPDGFLPRGVAPDGFRPDAFAAEGARRERATVQSRGTRLILLFARLLFMALVLATPGLVVASRASETDPFNFSIVVGLTLGGALWFVTPISHVLPALVVTIWPIVICAAILRYRLYDVDLVISRTFSYAALTVVLAGHEAPAAMAVW